VSEIRSWLASIGLAQYAEAFETNEIGMDRLSHVDDRMLKDLGESIGRIGCGSATRPLNSMPHPCRAQTNLPPKIGALLVRQLRGSSRRQRGYCALPVDLFKVGRVQQDFLETGDF
jgi:SAM domain (Sterile alpha motif)